MNTKIKTIDTIEDSISSLKNEKKIIHCHGVFDLLHIGHIKYFQEAKSFGDILIVTITPDHYVKKGPNRPAFKENHRAEGIAALEIVDFVVINKWPTAIEVIKIIKPDFYIKGPDYKDYEKDVSGNIGLEEEAVKSIGGQIAFTTDVTFSSSSLINQQIIELAKEQKLFLANLKNKYGFDKISEYINKIKNFKVLLLGEIIIDEYIFCDTIGKSGKEPVLVNKKLNSEKYAGGILAVANLVSDFYKEATIMTYLGDRDNQKEFITDKLNSNINLDYIDKENSPTILKTRFIDNYTKTKTLGVYDINDDLLSNNEEAEMSLKLENCIDEYDLVIAVDYGHGLITSKIVDILQQKSNYLAVNTQLNSFNMGYHSISKYNKANYVCVHEGELRHDYRNRSDTVESLIEDLSKRIKSNIIVITQGTKGSMAYDNNNFIYCPAYATKIVDRIGAGDTLLAITSLCLVAGIPTDLTLFIGNIAAAEMIASVGTGMKLNKIDLLKTIETLLK